MTREDIKTLFPDATDEQITSMLNKHNGEIAKGKAQAQKNADRIKELEEKEAELNSLKEADMTEAEKFKAELDKQTKRVAQLEAEARLSANRSSIADKFKVTPEQAKTILKDDGTLDYDVLGKIISDKEVAAATAKEQEIANGSTNPGGGNAGSTKEKTDAEQLAESIGKSMASSNKASNDIVNAYL